MSNEVLTKLKELKDVSRNLYVKLEEDGLKVSDPQAGVAKEQFFNNNVKNITGAMEGLMRGEPAERHLVRLAKEFPNSFENMKKIKSCNAGRLNVDTLNRIEVLLAFLENNYREL